MKMSSIVLVALLLAGCETSKPQASLTPERAGALALQLANEKADALYHCQPFHDRPPAQLVRGRWVWTTTRGLGEGDIEASVELSADGSAKSVEVQYLNNREIEALRMRSF